ncbi:Veg family protein [Peptoniphilus indolicus]|uniref:Veg protein n=2 Tax=Peptoniphilus indolicus TaxID=33030 RepID=G4D3R3_9FIRM|nr:Veg family protein [Peptoniphilus indolicus]EGY79832.1 veg protein [Peptoniphilus indolicus ATCC 29427]SUB75737.1 Uncharacterized protein conserved in bacteria [Peptoniphilus indolicus]
MNQMYEIRNELEENLGKKVIIKANKGRKKYITRRGVLESVYPSLFSISVENGDEKSIVTYTYSDVLTETVKILILDDDVDFSDLKSKKIS